jgi:hypothetical protein
LVVAGTDGLRAIDCGGDATRCNSTDINLVA